jgi:hypothetical protein
VLQGWWNVLEQVAVGVAHSAMLKITELHMLNGQTKPGV